jgi:hypothetical protein
VEVAVLQYSVRCRIARAVATTERRTEELRDIAGKLGLANINALAPQSTVTLPQIKASVIAGQGYEVRLTRVLG